MRIEDLNEMEDTNLLSTNKGVKLKPSSVEDEVKSFVV